MYDYLYLSWGYRYTIYRASERERERDRDVLFCFWVIWTKIVRSRLVNSERRRSWIWTNHIILENLGNISEQLFVVGGWRH